MFGKALMIKAPTKPKTAGRELWLVVCLALIASAAQFLTAQSRSMWLDEGLTLARVTRSWQDILSGLLWVQGMARVDDHPPLYFLLLKGWVTFGGQTDFTYRLFSALAGVLLVPLTYALARRLFGRAAGILGAFMALICPAYLWFGQEVRMYTLVTGLTILSLYCLYRAYTRRDLRFGVGWLIVTGAAMATHYTVAGLIAAEMLVVGLLLLNYLRKWRYGKFLVLLAGVFSLLALVAIVLFLRSHGQGQRLDGVIYDVMGAMLFGMNAADPTGGVINWAFFGLIVLGVLLPNPARLGGTFWQRLLLALGAAGPVLLLVSLTFLRANTVSFRHLMLIVPMLHILVAGGLLALWSYGRELVKGLHSQMGLLLARAGLAIPGVIVLGLAFGPAAYGAALTYTPSPTWQDDWRGMAEYVRNHWQEGDVFLVNFQTPDLVLAAYLQGTPITITPANSIHGSPAQARATLGQRYKRVWYAAGGGWYPGTHSFETDLLAGFSQREKVSFPARSSILDLLLFETTPPFIDQLPATATQTDAPSSAPYRIVAYQLSPGSSYNPQPNLWLTLYWQRSSAAPKADADSAVSILLTKDGTTWLDWLLPSVLNAAPQSWAQDQYYVAQYQVPVPPGLPGLDYQLELNLRMGGKGESQQKVVSTLSTEQLACCVRITQWPADPALKQAQWRVDGVTLISAEYSAAVMPGDYLPVALLWQLDQPTGAAWQTVLNLDGFTSGRLASVTAETGAPGALLDQWPVGEPERDMKVLQVPYTAQPGWYRLSVGRREDGQSAVTSAVLGLVQVKPYPFEPVVTSVPTQVNAQVGEFTLLGYGLYQPVTRETVLNFHTYWRADAAPQRDGVLFLHLVKPDGSPGSQDDNPPLQGKRSTLTYRAGEGIDQVHRIIIGADAPAGDYSLYAGIYNRTDQERWPAQQNGAPAQDNLVFLGTIHVP
jgi:4-amino-4-deoxy-L-arabinose transferase-like glycosyltransferase